MINYHFYNIIVIHDFIKLLLCFFYDFIHNFVLLILIMLKNVFQRCLIFQKIGKYVDFPKIQAAIIVYNAYFNILIILN